MVFSPINYTAQQLAIPGEGPVDTAELLHVADHLHDGRVVAVTVPAIDFWQAALCQLTGHLTQAGDNQGNVPEGWPILIHKRLSPTGVLGGRFGLGNRIVTASLNRSVGKAACVDG